MLFSSPSPFLPTSEGFFHKVPTLLPVGKRFRQQIGYVIASLDISRATFITGTALTDETEAYRLRFLLDC